MEMEIIIQTLSCSRCGHQWVPRTITRQCPRCKSFNWNMDKDYDKRKREFSTRSYDRRKRNQIKIDNLISNIIQKGGDQNGRTNQ